MELVCKTPSSMPADSDPLDESYAADALLLDAPVAFAGGATHGRGTGMMHASQRF